MKRLLLILSLFIPAIAHCQIGIAFAPASSVYVPPTANEIGLYDATIASSITIATGVSRWADQSGLGNDLLQATTSKQPSYASNTITFDGVSQFLSNTISGLTGPATYFLVGKQITWVSNAVIMDGHTSNTMMLRQATASPQVYLYAGSGFPTIGGWTINTTMVVTCQVNGASSFISINDGTKTTSSQVGAAAPGGIFLGQASFGGNANVGVVYLLIYNAALSSATCTAIVTGIRGNLHI